MKIRLSFKIKKSEENQLEKLKRKEKCMLTKFIDPIFVYRIKGDFIIPNLFDLYKSQSFSISLPELLEKVKFIKQIHFRPKGFLIEYDYLGLNYFPPVSLLIYRLESMGDDFLYRFAQVLKKFEGFDIRNKIYKHIQKNNLEHQRNSNIFEIFDKIFDEFQNCFVYIFGNQIVDDNDFVLKFVGINNNFKKIFASYDKETCKYDVFSQAFLKKFSSLISFDHFEHFITNAAGYMINLMTKNTVNEEKYEEIKCFQKIITHAGARSFPLTVIEKIIDEIFFCHICILDDFITFDSSKINKEVVSTERGIINTHQQLMNFYYKKKGI